MSRLKDFEFTDPELVAMRILGSIHRKLDESFPNTHGALQKRFARTEFTMSGEDTVLEYQAVSGDTPPPPPPGGGRDKESRDFVQDNSGDTLEEIKIPPPPPALNYQKPLTAPPPPPRQDPPVLAPLKDTPFVNQAHLEAPPAPPPLRHDLSSPKPSQVGVFAQSGLDFKTVSKVSEIAASTEASESLAEQDFERSPALSIRLFLLLFVLLLSALTAGVVYFLGLGF